MITWKPNPQDPENNLIGYLNNKIFVFWINRLRPSSDPYDLTTCLPGLGFMYGSGHLGYFNTQDEAKIGAEEAFLDWLNMAGLQIKE